MKNSTEILLCLYTLVIGLPIILFNESFTGSILNRDHQPMMKDKNNPNKSPHLPSLWQRRITRLRALFTLLWPRGDTTIRLRVICVAGLVMLGRIVNVCLPIYYKRIIDSLIVRDQNNGTTWTDSNYHKSITQSQSILDATNSLTHRWDLVLTFIVLRYLQGLGKVGSGLVGAIRSQLWIRINEHATRELSVLLYSHLHRLSLRWHLSKRTGEVLRIMDRGTTSLSNILVHLFFNILPTTADILVGVTFFLTMFNMWYGLLVMTTMVSYVVMTAILANWNANLQRIMNRWENQKCAKAVDALLNFETVKYFNAEKYEVSRFKDAFIRYQKTNWWSCTSRNILDLTQNSIIVAGLLVGTLWCTRDVVRGVRTVGDFVLFYTYIFQLYTPLSLFGSYYRLLQTNLIDMESMFELLDQPEEIRDQLDAPDLRLKGGEIEFRNVNFHYTEDRPILRNISFKVQPGQTVALVGHSGSGKSTIVRLMFRLYDVKKGEILIDGQNVAKVTQASLRTAIGVVPQDTVLFNDTIEYNIQYGRPDASPEQMRQSSRSAGIHSRVEEFPKNYATMVGERGLCLSGGEKQRIAIARNILKNPTILLLDEATSALDTATERHIQASLSRISRGRTTLVVAHRLSSVINADQILMIHQGQIVESGTHEKLMRNPDGYYSGLWRAQMESTGQPHSMSAPNVII